MDEDNSFEILQEKLLSLINEGLPLSRALDLEDVEDDLRERLESDDRFNRRVKVAKARLELKFLKVHKEALKIGAGKGNATQVLAFLAKINPENWGSVEKEDNTNRTLVIDKEDEKLV